LCQQRWLRRNADVNPDLPERKGSAAVEPADTDPQAEHVAIWDQPEDLVRVMVKHITIISHPNNNTCWLIDVLTCERV
jgi:hypothetical protein